MKLHGKVALVTGASRGIGRAIALAYGAQGAAVVVNYVRSVQGANEVTDLITVAGGRAIAVRGDAGILNDHEAMVRAALEAYGTIDILVNNAGVEGRAPFLEQTEEAWDRVMNVNLKGLYFLSQRVAKVMVETGRGGKIINVSSTHEDRPLRDASIYNISKGGLRMLTRSLAQELAPHGITVNALIPGAIRTDMNRAVLSNAEYEARVLEKIPLGRIAEPEEVAGAAVMLASSASNYMTGSSVRLDGGLSL